MDASFFSFAVLTLLLLTVSKSIGIGGQTVTRREQTNFDFQTLQTFAESALERLDKLERQVSAQDEKIRQLEEKNENLEQQNDKLQREKEELKAVIMEYVLREREKVNDVEATPSLKYNQEKKRADDTGSWEPVVNQLSSRVTELAADVQALKAVNAQQDQKIQDSKGSTFVRWGHGSCPNSSETVYSGTIGGSSHLHTGGAVNYLCLPPDPVYGGHATNGAEPSLYGSEYQTYSEPNKVNLLPRCAVCRTHRPTVLTIPAENVCRPGWTLEYTGYLMTGGLGHVAASEFVCVDSALEYVPGSNADENGKLLYFASSHCGSLPCPPFQEGKIVLCAVCSK